MNRRQLLMASAAAGVAVAGEWAAEAAEPPQSDKSEILMLVYPKFTILDLIGPHHVFSLLGPSMKPRLVWKDTRDVSSDTGVTIKPTHSFRECGDAPLVLFIPGGTDGTIAALQDEEVRAFVASRGAKAKYVTSVCTGSMVLGAAGLLKGYKATTHWLALEDLKKFGAEPVAERVVTDRNRITGAGVTAGIDFALTLAAKLQNEKYAKGVQLMMEYDPQPPFPKDGTPRTAEPENVKLLQAMGVPFRTELEKAVKTLTK